LNFKKYFDKQSAKYRKITFLKMHATEMLIDCNGQNKRSCNNT